MYKPKNQEKPEKVCWTHRETSTRVNPEVCRRSKRAFRQKKNSARSFTDLEVNLMDPEQCAIDPEGVRIIRQRRPRSDMYDLMSFGAQTHRGPSFNFPAISSMRDDAHYHKSTQGLSIVSQIGAQRRTPLLDLIQGRR